VSALLLQRRGSGPPAESIPGGYRLDAEPEWLVKGSPEELAAVRAAMPAVLCSDLGGVLLLHFGNVVGHVQAGPLGTLRVSSGKWTDADYAAMLDDISREALALPFAAGALAGSPFEQDRSPEAIPYHAFLWLKHALLDAPRRPLLGALQAILRDPHRTLIREPHRVPVELVSRLSVRALEDAFAGGLLQRAPPGQGARGMLPRELVEERATESVDTAENRFVKGFLEDCWRLVDRLRQGLDQAPQHVRSTLARALEHVEEALAPIRRAPLWRSVGTMAFFPASSSVLQRRAPYREILHLSNLLRTAHRALPLSSREVVRLLEIKDIAKLYELWCGFHLLGLLRVRLGPPSQICPLTEGLFGSSLRQGLHATWSTGVEFAINPTFTRKHGWHGASRSVQLRPDFALFLPDGEAWGLHLFDAKFRVKKPSRRPKEEDLVKMHAYRNAIPQARSASILYPGKHSLHYPDSPDTPSPFDGVGAFAAQPGHPSEALQQRIERLLPRTTTARTAV
jgi:predicted component of viral defense system (DUF524 family)